MSKTEKVEKEAKVRKGETAVNKALHAATEVLVSARDKVMHCF